MQIAKVAVALLLVIGISSPAYTMEAFLLVPNAKGESADAKYPGWIASIQSLNWGHQNMISSTGVGKVQFSPLTITKLVDAASVRLAQYTTTGIKLPEVILEIRSNPVSADFLKVRLLDVTVVGYKVDVPQGQALANIPRPLETVVFQFNKIEWTYTLVDPKGGPGPEIKGGYDLLAAKGF